MGRDAHSLTDHVSLINLPALGGLEAAGGHKTGGKHGKYRALCLRKQAIFDSFCYLFPARL